MTTTTVSDAVILPQSQGTGLSGENGTIDAAINGVLNRYVGGEYVASEYSTGLAFQNHDGTNDTVEVGPGICFIQDNSTSTGGQRSSGGNPQAESSTTSGYDTELPEGHTYAVLLPTATQISVTDSTLNEVFVDIDDVTANNSVNLEHDGSSAASPGNTSLKIGETNPDDASADTRANDDASPTFDSLTVNGTTDTDALNADNATVNEVFDGTGLDTSTDPTNPNIYLSFGEVANDRHGFLQTKTKVQGDNSVTDLVQLDRLRSGCIVVTGYLEGENSAFTDLLSIGNLTEFSVFQSETRGNINGNPDPRTYSRSQDIIELSIDDGQDSTNEYDVRVHGVLGR